MEWPRFSKFLSFLISFCLFEFQEENYDTDSRILLIKDLDKLYSPLDTHRVSPWCQKPRRSGTGSDSESRRN